MKRIILQASALILLVILLCITTLTTVLAAEETEGSQQLNNSIVLYVGSTKAIVNNKSVMVDSNNLGVYPIVKTGRTLIPLRFVAENFGAKVEWESKTSTIAITLNSKVIKLVVGKGEMMIDNASYKLDVPAEIIKGRTFVPLRALVEALGKKVAYYDGFIIISDQEIVLDPDNNKELIDELISRFNEYGNRMENLSNDGWVIEKEGWVYIASYEGIYKSKPDGSEKTKLCNDNAWDLNIVGDWIFYVNRSDIDNIYRIRTDGKQRGQLNRDRVLSAMVVKGDWIYYLTQDKQTDENQIIKMRLDGSNKTVITHGYDFKRMYMVGDWIYYHENFILKKVSVDGGISDNVISDELFSYAIIGDWIYYANLSDGSAIYKIRKDGFGRTKLSDNNCQEILVFEDWVYYANGSDGLKLYAVKTDGTEEYQLTEESVISINIFNDKVVYQFMDIEQ